MKTKFLLIAAGILLALTVKAQEPVFGVRGGLNIAKWKLGEKSSYYENNSRVGILLGINADFTVADPVSIKAEMLIGTFGSKFKAPGEKGAYKTSYLLFPVLANFHLENGLSFQMGPQLGLLLSANSVLDGEKYHFKDEMKKTDLFLVLGAEYLFDSGISVGFRIQHGLTNIEDGANTTIKNRAVSFNVNYTLQGSVNEALQKIF